MKPVHTGVVAAQLFRRQHGQSLGFKLDGLCPWVSSEIGVLCLFS